MYPTQYVNIHFLKIFIFFNCISSFPAFVSTFLPTLSTPWCYGTNIISKCHIIWYPFWSILKDFCQISNCNIEIIIQISFSRVAQPHYVHILYSVLLLWLLYTSCLPILGVITFTSLLSGYIFNKILASFNFGWNYYSIIPFRFYFQSERSCFRPCCSSLRSLRPLYRSGSCKQHKVWNWKWFFSLSSINYHQTSNNF